uniref:Fringe-like glycosyltransferase domain-containing protein n=1 Tax=Haptolina ericina TaxID=156174 RepID=A0A7S3BK96_9EUKA|eukprot:CAMPEP_0181177928 /NCGR_PEP_ID=MMETSP1096-20121128/5440_1 /TAXON_ID=156174 ORGANISM="Chrysochromulina ericina, Strain CCMP281" /NCGR_SAMPLE_ID=MMETSP1096 /ASSEMBLY_ACC=CAM_ASM_000453 /LENGTH=249 /DNA_ID=CAMNT_0023266147 /DNA_START=21 /DNA_END=770 /DNA_ORIENTATION=+
MTSRRYHDTRCQLIKQTYASVLPPTHYIFYSDADDPTLPAVRVGETIFPRAMPAKDQYMHAQLRWPEALRHAQRSSLALGTRWTMIVDDDTYVIPQNVLRVLRGYDPASPTVLLGQACPPIAGLPRICGGAGWVISTALHAALVAVLPRCTARSGAFSESHSDAFLSVCMHDLLQVDISDRAEFNSAEPAYYESAKGQLDRPRGYGAPATFHYIKSYEQWMTLHHLSSWAAQVGGHAGGMGRGIRNASW